MPTKKSTTKKPAKKTTKTTRPTKVTKATKTANTKSAKHHKNGCKTIILISVVIIVIGVLIFGGAAIYYAISRYHDTNARISDFSLITTEDRYNTIAMDNEHLEVIASDWGSPATERQVKINLTTGKTEAIIHYGRTDINNCEEVETNCVKDEIYYGTLDEAALTQVTNSAKAILGNDAKATYNLSDYALNEALIELCQTVINNLEEK